MEESLVKPFSRPQSPAGCVGMFYQLFDWNRRLANKKLFSNKLLPPAGAKRAANKFGEDDKLPTPKLLLIAQENRGGFPNANTPGVDINVEMPSPSLVARLMGLESIPAMRQENLNNTLNSEFGHGRNHVVGNQDESYLGKGDAKVDTRPQKLQKTGRRQVTSFGAEALQCTSVLSRSRKHQPKIVSPVKSPRVRRNASRLMGAATKILEPGMYATSRAKCALTYSPACGVTSSNEDMKRGRSIQLVEDSEQHKYYASHFKPLKGQPPCKGCGNWLDVVDSRPVPVQNVMDLTTSTVGLGSAPPLRPKLKQYNSPLQETVRGTLTYQGYGQKFKSSTEINHTFQEYRDHYDSPTHQTRSENDVAPSRAQNPRMERQSQMLPMHGGSAVPKLNNINSRSDVFAVKSSYGTKIFVGGNQNSVPCVNTGIRSNSSNNRKNNTERNSLEKDNSLSRLRGSVRQKRLINGTTEVENSSATSRKSRDIRNDAINRRCPASNGCSRHQNGVKSKYPIVVTDASNSPKDNGVISFTFNSPMRQKSDSSSPKITKEKRSHAKCASTGSTPKNLTLDTEMGKSSSCDASPLKRDAIGVLLEEKLKELTCRDRDELETGDGLPGKSTAAILEELILALTAERPISMEDKDDLSVEASNENSNYASEALSDDIISKYLTGTPKGQVVPKSCLSFSGFLLGVDGEHDSPGSILDASFSIESYFSESHASTGHTLQSEQSMEGSYSQPQPSEYDTELSDCATSTSNRMTDSFDSIHRELCSIDQDDMEFVQDKLNYSLKLFLDTDHLHGSTTSDAHSLKGFPVTTLLDKLESLPLTPWATTKYKTRFTRTTEKSQSRFLLDCFLEFLHSKYTLYFRSRLKAWSILPLQITEDSLMKEVHQEIQKWADVADKSLDEILEEEMNHSGKWMDNKMESFEIGAEVEYDILEVLVCEVVIDLEQWKTCRR